MVTMRSISVLATCFLSVVTPAVGLPAQNDAQLGGRPTKTTASQCSPTPPSTGTGTDVPAPPAGAQFRYVTLGRGTQNYTCSGDGAVPVQIGAHAYLYDVTDYYCKSPQFVQQAPSKAVYLPLDRVAQFSISGAAAKFGYIGFHEFATTTTPAFYLTSVNRQIYAQKQVAVLAPPGADQGPDKTAAVAWVELVKSTTYTAQQSIGLSTVYRVDTAGGSAYPTCNSTNYDHTTGLMLIDYAALYFFYE